MIDDTLKKEILESIANTGSIESNNIVNGNVDHIISRSSGMPRLQTNAVRKFKLILSQPSVLTQLNPFEIRCALCKRAISYPCWYFDIKYTVNHFHYFVCFDSDNSNKPTVKCYRRI